MSVEAELDSEAVRLLEVVAEDLLVLDDPVTGHPLEPGRELFVENGAEPLRGRAIRHVADEDVLEPEGRLAGEDRVGRADEVLPREGVEALGHRGGRRLGELLDRAAVEHLALHGGTFDGGAFPDAEAVEPRGEYRVQARGQCERREVAVDTCRRRRQP